MTIVSYMLYSLYYERQRIRHCEDSDVHRRTKQSSLGILMKKGYVYILANITNRVLYTGVTSNLVKRVYEHKQHLVKGFTAKYSVEKLVYFEIYENVNQAIAREKQIKGGSREKKLRLIETINPTFEDLYKSII